MAKKVAATGPVKGPWTLPDGWRWESIGTVCRPTEKGSPASRFADTFRYTDVGGIGEGVGAKVVPVGEAPSRARQFVRPGDTLFSGVRVNLRRTVFVKPNMTDVASTAFSVLSPGVGVEPSYLFRWMTSDFLVSSLISLQRGSQPPAVLDDDVRAQPIAVPPLNVQHKIIARIDELFAEIDDGEAALARARNDLSTWRKALLKAAVTGELTADWRSANPSGGTGANLLKHILAERSATPKKKQKPSIELVRGDSNVRRPLPESWARCVPSQIVGWSSGKFMPDRSMNSGDVPVYGGNGIAGFHDEALVNKPTLVIGRVGHYCGNAYATEGAAWISDNAIYASEVSAGVSVSYLRLVFEQVNLRSLAQGGAQPFVSQTLLNSISIPLPGEQEQIIILEAVQRGLAEAKELELFIEHAGSTSSMLRQSILAAAFRGELA